MRSQLILPLYLLLALVTASLDLLDRPPVLPSSMGGQRERDAMQEVADHLDPSQTDALCRDLGLKADVALLRKLLQQGIDCVTVVVTNTQAGLRRLLVYQLQ